MSYDLFVYTASVPEKLREEWPAALAASGLVAEVQPDFDPEDHDGLLTWKVHVASAEAFRYASRYPAKDIEVGFELTTSSADEIDMADWKTAAPDVVKRVSAAEYVFAFSSAHDCTPAEFRLQWFAAAALAQLTDGVVQNPLEDQSFTGKAALAEAEFQSDKFEEDRRDDWPESTVFTSW